jgi:PAS domain S-box-containing protein
MFRDISRRKEIEAGLSAAHKKITAQSRELKLRLEELEKASQALVRNEKDFESMVECAPDAIYLSDSERFVYANTAFARMLGATSPDQLIGMPVYDRIHPDCHALVRERANQIHGEGKPSGLKDVVYLKMDGTPVNVETSAAPFRFRGQTAGLVILRDISVRKQAQDELRLASLHAEEAAKLAQKKLYMVSEITRHEIRNAITGIIGSVDLAYQLPAGTERDQLNRDIKDLALRIQRQIEFTREYEEIGIREPQWHQVRLLIPACEKPRMNISKGLEALEIYADPLITKIFTYLVENVIRHGRTATEIGIRDDGCAGGKFRILFEDNGVGIPADIKKKIFERKIGDSQGMGLFVVREILLITGITMTETGTPGLGARFEILVPEEGFRFRKTD